MLKWTRRLNQERYESLKETTPIDPRWKRWKWNNWIKNSKTQINSLKFHDLWRSCSRGFKSWKAYLKLRPPSLSEIDLFEELNFSDNSDNSDSDENDIKKIKDNRNKFNTFKVSQLFAPFKIKKMSEPEFHDVNTRQIQKIAIISRFIVLFLSLIGKTIPFHLNDGFKFDSEDQNGTILDHAIKFTFDGFTNWDGQYFLHITTNGYTHMNTAAFFPLFPITVSIFTKIFHFFLFPFVSFSSLAILIGWLFNIWLFQSTVVLLNFTTIKMTEKRNIHLENVITVLFCFNPASIFFSSFYSESLYAYLTMRTIYHLCVENAPKAIFFASLSALCRSNGILNFGFIGFFIIQRFLDFIRTNQYYTYQHILQIIKLSLLILIGLIPFVTFQLYCAYKFCDDLDGGPFCGYQLPYSFIQKNNWDVGFLKYFQLRQIPNFILAAPILSILCYESYLRFRINFYEVWELKNYNYIFELYCNCHGLFLAAFCFFCMHVQVSTRLILAACPYLYIYIAHMISCEFGRFREKSINWTKYTFAILIWCLLYFIIGTLAFTRGYPWT